MSSDNLEILSQNKLNHDFLTKICNGSNSWYTLIADIYCKSVSLRDVTLKKNSVNYMFSLCSKMSEDQTLIKASKVLRICFQNRSAVFLFRGDEKLSLLNEVKNLMDSHENIQNIYNAFSIVFVNLLLVTREIPQDNLERIAKLFNFDIAIEASQFLTEDDDADEEYLNENVLKILENAGDYLSLTEPVEDFFISALVTLNNFTEQNEQPKIFNKILTLLERILKNVTIISPRALKAIEDLASNCDKSNVLNILSLIVNNGQEISIDLLRIFSSYINDLEDDGEDKAKYDTYMAILNQADKNQDLPEDIYQIIEIANASSHFTSSSQDQAKMSILKFVLSKTSNDSRLNFPKKTLQSMTSFLEDLIFQTKEALLRTRELVKVMLDVAIQLSEANRNLEVKLLENFQKYVNKTQCLKTQLRLFDIYENLLSNTFKLPPYCCANVYGMHNDEILDRLLGSKYLSGNIIDANRKEVGEPFHHRQPQKQSLGNFYDLPSNSKLVLKYDTESYNNYRGLLSNTFKLPPYCCANVYGMHNDEILDRLLGSKYLSGNIIDANRKEVGEPFNHRQPQKQSLGNFYDLPSNSKLVLKYDTESYNNYRGDQIDRRLLFSQLQEYFKKEEIKETGLEKDQLESLVSNHLLDRDTLKFFCDVIVLLREFTLNYKFKTKEHFNDLKYLMSKFPPESWTKCVNKRLIELKYGKEQRGEKKMKEILTEFREKNASIVTQMTVKALESDILTIKQENLKSKLVLNGQKPISQWETADISKFSKIMSAKEQDFKQHFVIECLAVVKRALQLVGERIELRDAQLLASLWVLKYNNTSMLMQMSTGEGKTTVLNILSICVLLLGRAKQVYNFTSSPDLAKRDAKKNKKLFAMFNLNVSENSDKRGGYIEGPKNCYSAQIVYGEGSQFLFDTLRHEYSGLNTFG
jgi:hypothetical protein